MFTTKRRPAPSKAALRVLYQLAYISSGTAVGAGVLCAEERRRRTQMVQRIADNAKKIRQHPRYATNAALAVKEGEGEARENGVTAQWEGPRKENGGRYGAERENDAVKGQFLPSVVREEYGAVNAKERRRKAKRSENGARSSTAALGVPRLNGALHEYGHAMLPQGIGSQETRKSRIMARRPTQPHQHRPSHRDPARAEMTIAEALRRGSVPPRRTALQRSKTASVSSPFPGRCRDLLNSGRVSEAVDAYVRLVLHRPQTRGSFKGFKELFDAALRAKLFAKCAELLRVHSRHVSLPVSRCGDLIEACGKEGDYDSILDLFFRREPMPLDIADKLSIRAQAVLAMACSTDKSLSASFEMVYGLVNAASRDAVDAQRRHLLLTVTWRRTRNLGAVIAHLHPMVKHLEQVGKLKAIEAIDKIMVEIYISANRTDEALNTIARLHRRRNGRTYELQCMLLAALAYASRRAWSSFYEVLRIAESTQMAEVHKDNLKVMNNIVRAYASCHAASQTWRFVSYLKEKFHYRPSHAAHRFVLEAFVSQKAVGLIPKWLRLHKVHGDGFEIDTQTAAQLLSRYYQDHRPSHVLVMWFCRNLAHMVPTFDPQEFFPLITQSIGYDLSGALERNAVWQQDHAQQRLERVRAAEDHVPSPGYKYSRKLYFQHPNAPAEASIDTSQESQLSPDDQSALEATMVPQSQRTSRKPDTLRDAMSLELSLNRYQKVLDLYEQSLDVLHAPDSAATLIIAVRASLKLHGHDEHAQQVIGYAERAGIHVVGALAPVVMFRMRNFDPSDPTSASRLRDLTAQYYEVAERNGLASRHDVGLTAANLLITSGYPGRGVNLLRGIAGPPKVAGERSINIVFMTVMVKGYIALGQIRDVIYWAHEALKSGVMLSPNFVRELQRGLKAMAAFSTQKERSHLATYISMCKAKRQEQALETKLLGKELVATISKCMRGETTVDVDERAELDEELFGPMQRRRNSELLGETDDEAVERPRLTRRERLAQNREAVAKAIQHDPSTSFSNARQFKRMTDVRWMRQYRAFLRRPMVLEDGRHVPFRYYLPSESAKWRGKESVRRVTVRARRERFWDEHSGK